MVCLSLSVCSRLLVLHHAGAVGVRGWVWGGGGNALVARPRSTLLSLCVCACT